MILQDTLQVSLVEHKSREEQEARENVELVNEHLASVEIEKMVKGPENVIDDSSIPRNDDQNIPGTRLVPRSDKESPEMEITNDEEVEITNVVILVNVNEEEEEITDEVYELKAKFLSRKSFDTLADHLQEVMVESLPTMIQQAIDINIPSLVNASVRSYMSGHILHVHPAQPQTSSVPEQQYQLYLSVKAIPQTSGIHPRDHDDPRNDAHLKGENSAKRNQEQTDDYDFWTDSYASDDDEILTKQVSQDIMEEVSLT
ncbi:hypothetical protein Tco_1534131, partial [Tanacetum coccineum]